MTEFPVKYRLYNEAGSGLLYTFTYVQDDTHPKDPVRYVEIEGLRGQGSIVIPGSISAWDLSVDFLLLGEDYEDLIAQMDTVESTIIMQTRYVLKIDRTSSTTQDYNVMRLSPIQFGSADFRTQTVEASVTFRVNSW